MGDMKLLLDKIIDSHYSITYIAKRTGISRTTLYHRLAGRREFKTTEIKALKELLNLSNKELQDIFFA